MDKIMTLVVPKNVANFLPEGLLAADKELCSRE